VPSPSPHRPALQPRLHRKIVIFIAGQPGGANPQNTKQSEPRPWDRLSVLRVADAGPARLAASSPQSPEIQAPKVAILATTIVQSAACRLLGQGETCQARASWPNVEAAVLKDGGAGRRAAEARRPVETRFISTGLTCNVVNQGQTHCRPTRMMLCNAATTMGYTPRCTAEAARRRRALGFALRSAYLCASALTAFQTAFSLSPE
jgi:hypothetical protein